MTSDLERWTTTARTALDLEDDVDIGLLLSLARDAAHRVVRPAAPVTTYLLGLAVARGADPRDAVARLRAVLPPEEAGSDGSETPTG